MIDAAELRKLCLSFRGLAETLRVPCSIVAGCAWAHWLRGCA
jgi:hypothetical protein